MRFRTRLNRVWLLPTLVLAAALSLAACGGDSDIGPDPEPDPGPEATAIERGGGSLVVYSGRSESLVGPALEAFEKETGIDVRVRYASSASIAATILEEGSNSPADVVFMQDAGALGALANEGFLAVLPGRFLDLVDPRFRSPIGEWVGTSGRARTVVYNVENIDPATDLPDSILGFVDPIWKGRIGFPPTNGSFQAFVTALRFQIGEEATRDWLKGIKDNDPKRYGSNTPTVDAVASGEIDVGFVNHYYLHRFLAERGERFGARNFYYGSGDPGALVNVAGVAVLKTAEHTTEAERFVEYMLGVQAQTYFSEETFEFPLVAGVPSPAGVPSLGSLNPPDLDLSSLSDLRATLELLTDVGLVL